MLKDSNIKMIKSIYEEENIDESKSLLIDVSLFMLKDSISKKENEKNYKESNRRCL